MPFKPRGERITITYCWPMAESCEFRREEARKLRSGKTEPCLEASVAYCTEFVEGPAMSVMHICMGTMDDCLLLREELKKQKISLDQLSACQPTRNDKRFERFRVIDAAPRADYLVPKSRSPASPSPGRM